MESMSLVYSMTIIVGLNLFGKDLNIFLTTLELGIGSPRLNEEFTMSLNSE